MGKLPLIALSALFLTGCGPSSETTKGDDIPEHAKDLWKSEAEFDPSDYNPDVAAILEEVNKSNEKDQEAMVEVTNTEPVEFVSGFRVQIFASSNIDQANSAKLEAEALFPDQWFYLVYDTPTYKIRAGDFLQRYEADKFAKQLAEHGYYDAWIVPERVYKNPPKRTAPEQNLRDQQE
jgi:hypothetical protein